jgi:hypothetical protein
VKRDGEAAVFQVVEAIFVAVLVASALIFFALVQKPTPSPAGAGVDLARVASDALDILQGDAPGNTSSDQLQILVRPLLPSATLTQKDALRTAVDNSLPDGLRFLVRATAIGNTTVHTATIWGPCAAPCTTEVPLLARNGQGAVAYVYDDGTDYANALVLVELVVWNAF